MIAGCALGVVTPNAARTLPASSCAAHQCRAAVRRNRPRGAITEASAKGAKLIPAQGASRVLRKGEYGRLQLLNVSSTMLVTRCLSALPAEHRRRWCNRPALRCRALSFPDHRKLLMHDMSVVREQRALRQRPKSMIAGSIRILRWAITCPLVALGVAIGGKPTDKAEPQRLKPLAVRPWPLPRSVTRRPENDQATPFFAGDRRFALRSLAVRRRHISRFVLAPQLS